MKTGTPVRVTAGEIRAGDYVHDTFGRPSRVTAVRALVRGRVKVLSALWPATWNAVDVVTIVRGSRCSSCYAAAYGDEPDMGEPGATFGPGECTGCGTAGIVWTVAP